jgi:hypothetical protein
VGEQLADQLELSNEERTLLLRGLTGHVMELETEEGREIAPQVRGQLMGSVVSFPVLCLVNAALCLAAYEIDRNQRLKLSQLPLCVNGDDAVLRGGPLLKAAWEKMAHFVGMKPSVGKVYYSTRYLNINSTSYEYHPDGYLGYREERQERDGTVTMVHRLQHLELIQYVNMGLLYGLTRSGLAVGLDTAGDPLAGLGVRAHALLSFAPSDLRLKVYKAYLSRNKDTLAPARVPWFTPTHLGGLGLPILDKFRPNDLDLRVARKIYMHPDKFPVPRVSEESTWLTWKLAQARMDAFPLGAMAVRSSYGLPGGSVQTLMGTLCIEALFMKDGFDLNPELYMESHKVLRFAHENGLASMAFPDRYQADGERTELQQLAKKYRLTKALKALATDLTQENLDQLDRPSKVFQALQKQARLDTLNALRSLNQKVLKDRTIPLPEPFRVDAIPSRGLSTSALEGAYSLTLDLPFGRVSNFD